MAASVDEAVDHWDEWVEFSRTAGDRAVRVFAHWGREAADAWGELMRGGALLGIYQWKLLTTGKLEAASVIDVLDGQLRVFRKLHAPWLPAASHHVREDGTAGAPHAAAAE